MSLNARTLITLLPGLLCACTSISSGLDAEVVSSMHYDGLRCEELVARRNSLAARHGEPELLEGGDKPGGRSAMLPPGLGTLLPDARSSDTKERRKALGEIEAMDRSIKRRDCTGAQ